MQSVIEVSGTIRHRDEETYNPRLATGEVELKAEKLTVLSEAEASALLAGRGRARPRGASAQVPLSGHPPPRHAEGAQASAIRCSRPQSIILDEDGLLSGGDPHALQVHPRGRTGLPGAQPGASGHLLCPAPKPANLQAAADGGRASTSTTRWPAASGTRTCGPTASRSSPRWIWKCPLWTRRTSCSTLSGSSNPCSTRCMGR